MLSRCPVYLKILISNPNCIVATPIYTTTHSVKYYKTNSWRPDSLNCKFLLPYMEPGDKTLEDKKETDCTVCRVSGTLFLSGLTAYSFICARKAKPRSFHRAFCLLFGSTSFSLEPSTLDSSIKTVFNDNVHRPIN